MLKYSITFTTSADGLTMLPCQSIPLEPWPMTPSPRFTPSTVQHQLLPCPPTHALAAGKQYNLTYAYTGGQIYGGSDNALTLTVRMQNATQQDTASPDRIYMHHTLLNFQADNTAGIAISQTAQDGCDSLMMVTAPAAQSPIYNRCYRLYMGLTSVSPIMRL